ncbi:type II toxin-antitoxin system RelE/ParE family toxin [Lacticaseibacillus sharpeae]|uniref:type II toxin-antitoxin system RelE/ParE family toxin n=1 Tax=Lacticaseibacillus sharpeae TaxID=1626 RepID=UPI0006D04263|nr:type II toxin-antitoxin system RelE/ParE family toxin [Lacticaseibacillus sharpeae]
MYRIDLYEDKDGYSDVDEYIQELTHSTNKQDIAILKKIRYQLTMLESLGPALREPPVKELKGYKYKLFELRPQPERIFFAFWDTDRYVLLSHYTKKQNKTDSKQIDRALKRLEDWLKRKGKL